MVATILASEYDSNVHLDVDLNVLTNVFGAHH